MLILSLDSSTTPITVLSDFPIIKASIECSWHVQISWCAVPLESGRFIATARLHVLALAASECGYAFS